MPPSAGRGWNAREQKLREGADVACVPALLPASKQAKLMKSMKFPKELEQKVDLKKVNWTVMREWIAKRVTELLGLEDDVLINFLQIRLESEEVRQQRSV